MKTYTLVLKDGERELASWQVDPTGHVLAFIEVNNKKCANPLCPWEKDEYRLQDMILYNEKYYCCEDCRDAVTYAIL